MDRLWTPWRYGYISSAVPPKGCVFCVKAAEKKDAAFSSAGGGETATSSGVGTKVSSLATQTKTKAQENPALAATAMAFLGGFLLGRRRSC